MKTFILVLAAVLLDSCNNPPRDGSGQTDNAGGAPDTGSVTNGAQQNNSHDTTTWEGATNDTGSR